jgi:hypothetical protein
MEQGTCPVCNGSTRVPAGDNKYKQVISGYDKDTDTFKCTNCGGQYMYGRSTGQVRLNKEGVPCTHQYQSQTIGRCLTQYTCLHCGDRHDIDSGD